MVTFLRSRDTLKNIVFVDIGSPSYKPELFGGIGYREAMGRIHGITSSGEVLKDVQVFYEAYRLVDLGWLYAPTRWPVFRQFANLAYRFWAYSRLLLTGRPSLDQLCKRRLIDLNKNRS